MNYLNELVEYGGLLVPRGEMIADLQRIARNAGHANAQALVDRYLQGLDAKG